MEFEWSGKVRENAKVTGKSGKCDRDMLGVRTDAKSVLKAICKKLLQKTPITCSVARALSCLDPRNMAGSPEQRKTMMRRLLSATQHVLKAVLLLKRTV